MLLPICNECPHGGVKDGLSHCSKESVYSYLSRCIRGVALEDYLQRHAKK